MWHRHAYQDDIPGEGWVADSLDVLIRLAKFTQPTALINNQVGAGSRQRPGPGRRLRPRGETLGGWASRVGIRLE